MNLKLELEKTILDNNCNAPISIADQNEYEFFKFQEFIGLDKITGTQDTVCNEFKTVSEALDHLANYSEIYYSEN